MKPLPYIGAACVGFMIGAHWWWDIAIVIPLSLCFSAALYFWEKRP